MRLESNAVYFLAFLDAIVVPELTLAAQETAILRNANAFTNVAKSMLPVRYGWFY